MKTSHARAALLSSVALLLASAHAAAAADSAARAAKASADAPMVPDKIREAMQDRRYGDAVAAIDESLQSKDAPADYLVYLKGRALHLDGKYDDAIAVFDHFATMYPTSPWARRVRFAKAVALARKGDFRAAELIYRAEAEYLLSSERKQQLADIYLEFADAYFKPLKEEQKPDYAKALEFYKKALDAGAKPEKQAEIELAIGECLQNLNNPGGAAAQFEQIINERTHHAQRDEYDIEARYRLGTCRLAGGDPREARRVWQDLLAKYVDSPSPRVADAQFDLSRTWNIPNPQDDEQLNLGTAALRTFLERFPTHKNAGRAYLEIAQSYLNRGRAADAAAALKQFLADAHCRDAKELPEGQELLGRAYLAQKDFDKALAAFRDFLAKYPAHEQWSRVQQSIVETEYLMAAEQLAAKKYAEANRLFAEFLAKYPLDARAPDILLAMNQENVAEEKWDAAIAGWRRLVSKYPGAGPASLAQYLIAETLERKLGRLDDALDEYRKVTWGPAQGRAMQAAARLTAKTMSVATERVFRSDEIPKLKLVSRNIESVTVRVYKVDLETYFRKMHLARGVEGLDIALIDPDATFEFKVPKYAKHQEIESVIPVGNALRGVPADGTTTQGTPQRAFSTGGAMAVTVTSKSLEATTMVIQSDLDVIVKSSRDEVFVFAENMLTGKPWPNVRLLVSNGREVIGEGVTDAHGVFQESYKDFPASTSAIVTVPDSATFGGLPGAGVGAVPSRPAAPQAPGTDPFGTLPPPSQPAAPKPANDDPFSGPPPPNTQPTAPPPPTPSTSASPSNEPPPVDNSAPAQTAAPPQQANPEASAPGSPAAESRGAPMNADDVRVFAVVGGNVASNIVNLQGVGVAQGLTDKGYIYTDRPAYRAGQLVNIRGCLRRAVNDAYVIDKDKPYTVEVFDARNRPIRQEKIKLDAFGSFHVHFLLPPDSPQGQYRVLVHDQDTQNFQGTFVVQEYQIEPIRLVVDTPRRVYYRGEPIEGTIRAEFYYGAPVAGREIRYQLAGDRFQTATTDAKGEVHFKLDTREYSESQVLPLNVAMPEGNVNTQVNFVLAAEGFSIGVSTVRPVYVTGESLEATINIRDAENKPLAQKFTLKVLERTLVDNRYGERVINEHELTTAADGKARQTLKLDQGGTYFLRAEAVDRFHNPISGQATVGISGEDDLVRLRILADRHTYKVGDTAAVELHWREPPALALVTYQGARVLDYRLVELKTGANRLEIPMTAQLAPNFELAVAVMTQERGAGSEASRERELPGAAGKVQAAGNNPHPNPLPRGEGTGKRAIIRFHTASSPFTVERDLRVKMTFKPKSPHPGPLSGGEGTGKIRPGEDLEVTITTTDPQGKPVAAELSLALVEQSLLERFASPLPAIGDFFRGGQRESAVRSTSSITFNYHPDTRPINPRLLAEKDREEVAREEEESLKLAHAAASPAGGEIGYQLRVAGDGQGQGSGADPSDINGFFLRGNVEGNTLEVDGNISEVDGNIGGVASLGGSTIRGFQTMGRSYNRSFEDKIARHPGSFDYSNITNNALAHDTTFAGAISDPFSGAATTTTKEGRGTLVLNSQMCFNGGTTITGGVLNLLQSQGQNQLQIVDNSGNCRSVRLGDSGPLDSTRAAALAAELNASGAILLSALLPQETGYFNPSVTTSTSGTAALTLTMPDRSTAWKLLAEGITAETLAGDASDDIVVKKDLFGQIKLPLAFTDGDTAEIPVSVHNDAIEKGTIEVVLRTTIAGRKVEETKRIEVSAKGLREVGFKVELKRPVASRERELPGAAGNVQAAGNSPHPSPLPEGEGTGAPQTNVQFELVVRAAGLEDVVERSVPLKPYGVPVYREASGSGTSDQTVWVEAPEGMPAESAAMQIIVGPSVQRSLLDIVLGPAPWCQLEAGRLASGLEVAASDAMAALALQKLLGTSRDAGGPEALALDSRIRAAISLLLAAQNDDGSWSWTGAAGAAGNRYASCRIAWSMTLLRQAGYVVPDEAYNKALAYLRNQVTVTEDADYESRAMLLHALAVAGQGDFALANRLYRDRNSLSTAALAHLALGFSAMDRKATAKEILDLLEKRDLDERTPHAPHEEHHAERDEYTLSWNSSDVELRALYALALEDVAPKSTKAKELTDWLLAHRTGNRWSPEKATGPAAMALCRWYADSRFSGERYKLTVFVNDVQVKALDVGPAAGSQTIDVPRRFLKQPGEKGKQRVNFRIEGRGQYTFQCILGGFVPADKIKSTTQAWQVTRYYEPAPLELDGREIPRGFGVLEGNYQTFRNSLEQLPVGRRGMVDITLWRGVWNTPEERLEYLVVTEPIPSGATVIEKSIHGPFERYEIGPGEITFYVGSRAGLGTIHYELYGYVPGSYRIGPTIVRNAHRPEQLVAAAPKSLAVLAQGTASADAYRETPQELYELGKRLEEKKDYAAAGKYLTDLVDHWNLRPDIYKPTVETLLDIHLQIGPPAKIVHYFEIIKEKWPFEEVPFAKIVKVGAAYHELGEYERSYLVFRATVESNFARESEVAGFLDAQGELLRSFETMSGLLREYPPEGYIAAASYCLAQQVAAKAPEAAGDAKLRQAKVNRVDLLHRGWTMIESFLTAWPDDPSADQAAFAAAGTLLDLKAYREATAACGRYAKRYATSDLVDSFWYIIGYCEFAEGQHKAALAMCEKVAEWKHVDKATGREIDSPNKWQAIYILGQIYHGLGEAAAAIREYRRVEDRFADAKEAIEYFARKAIELPEATTVKPGDKGEVELKFRNIASCDVKVYRIDLMKFSLLRRNLGGIAQINLAGIRPLFETSVPLGDGRDYRDRTTKLSLPLKDEGAYLVVCRGEDLHASGLVLVTPLAVEVQEDATSGRVRTTVKDVKADRYVHNVQVKVIGSGNDDFVDGATDLRGVFVADGIRGQSTVIARAEGGRYAFFRGKMNLGNVPAGGMGGMGGDAIHDAQGVPPPSAPAPAAAVAPCVPPEKALLENVQSQCEKFQGQQQENLKRIYDNKAKGVEIKAAY